MLEWCRYLIVPSINLHFMPGRLNVILGDITALRVEAIVNAANNSLLGGGGVDGAIHHAAGPELLEECRQIGGCPTGEARITGGHKLPARWVIHTVGPIWQGGSAGEDQMLGRSYRSCFDLVKRCDIKSVAFPSISTGAYGFPVERACRIALAEMRSFLEETEEIEVTAVCFNQRVYESYLKALEELESQQL
jgi:O-acetyl-ADP-ribose deacetylase (regulator of RNase III)